MCLHKGTAARTIETNIHSLIEKRLDFLAMRQIQNFQFLRRSCQGAPKYHLKTSRPNGQQLNEPLELLNTFPFRFP